MLRQRFFSKTFFDSIHVRTRSIFRQFLAPSGRTSRRRIARRTFRRRHRTGLGQETLEHRICLTIVPIQLLPDTDGPQQTGEWKVAASADYRAIGVPEAHDLGMIDAGFAAVYDANNELLLSIPNPEPQTNGEFGKSIAISGTLLAVSAQYNMVNDQISAGKVYIFDLSSATPTEPIHTLTASTPAAQEGFGNAVAFDGDILAVAAMRANAGATEAGEVTIFDLSSATPTVPALTIANPNPDNMDWFGWSVAVEGERLVVGTLLDDATGDDSGSAQVFDLSSATPTVPVTTLDHPNPTEAHQFSGAIAISNGQVLVGSRLDSAAGVFRAGAAHLYDLNSSTPQTAVLTIENPDPRPEVQFGYALDIDGQQAVVGVWLDTPGTIPTAGSTYVFQLDSATPTIPSVTLQEPNPQQIDEFGYTVAIAGDTVLATSRFDSTGTDYGFVYDLSGSSPEASIGTLQNPTPAISDRFGFSVAVDGNLMAVGSPFDDDAGINSGAVYVYDLSSGEPTFMTKLLSPTPSPSDAFGSSVVVSGSRIAVGVEKDDTGAENAGSVFVYDMSAAMPSLAQFSLHNPSPNANDAFGNSLALDGETLVVGAESDDSAAVDSGTTYVFDLSTATPEVAVLTLQHPAGTSGAAFGGAVAVDDQVVVVGAASSESAFAFDLTSPTPHTPIITFADPTPLNGGIFGYSVAIDGDHVVVGAPSDANRLGAAYVYQLSALDPSSAIVSLNYDTPNLDDLFGYAVDISGDKILVSAVWHDLLGDNAGQVYAYDLASGTPADPIDSFTQPTTPIASAFGEAIAISGGVQLIGVSNDSTANINQGAVYAYVENTLPTIAVQDFAVAEDDNGVAPFATVAASDAQSAVTFSIDGGSGAGLFTIDPQTGELTVTGPLDFESIALYDLEISVLDDFGAASTAIVTINVTNVNEAPVASDVDFGQSPWDVIGNEDTVLTQQLGVDVPLDSLATDVDTVLTTASITLDAADVTVDGQTTAIPNLADIGVTYHSVDGQFALNPIGIALFQSLADGELATVAIHFTASDGELSDAGTLTYVIAGINDAPVVSDDTASTGSATPLAPLDVLSNDSDLEGDLLTVTEVDSQLIDIATPVTLVSGAIVSLNADGTLAYDPSGAFDSITTPTDDLFTYTVSDGIETSTGQVTVSIVLDVIAPDFNDDGVIDDIDIDMLQANIVTGPADPATFDLNGDGLVTIADRNEWLVQAGAANLPSGGAYLIGDINLDGTVNGADFVIWNTNRFTVSSHWSDGDLNSDGTINGADFILWNTFRFQSSDQVGHMVPPTISQLAVTLNHALDDPREDRSFSNLIDDIFSEWA